MSIEPSELDAYLADCRQLTLHEIQEIIPKDERYRPVLYDLMLEYPLRNAKALRPALCIATCRSLGGSLEAVLRLAATLELYHNAFLIHDDVEDGSENRRDQPTLHRTHGMPVAVNVGDAMLALALQPLLDNMRLIGMGKALRILQTIARMARESAEGQALELQWIRSNEWQLTDTDYVRMVYKKTSWYTFIAPVLIGGIVVGLPPERLATLRRFAALLGIAFQIQDDVLNLACEGAAYGKEITGDLWEGKHTLILMHTLRAATRRDRARAIHILSKARPQGSAGGRGANRSWLPARLLTALERDGDLSAAGRRAIEAALTPPGADAGVKTVSDIRFLIGLIDRCGSIDYARRVSLRFAGKAEGILKRAAWLPPSVHTSFLHALVDFVVQRNR